MRYPSFRNSVLSTPDPTAFTRQVLAAVHTLTLTTVGPILADGDAPCFAYGPIGIKRATLVLLATLAPERWNACSLAVFDDHRSAVITADDAPPIQPADEYRHRFMTLAAPEAPERVWRADVARLVVRTWRDLRGADPYLRCKLTGRPGGRVRVLLMPAETARSRPLTAPTRANRYRRKHPPWRDLRRPGTLVPGARHVSAAAT